MQDGAGLTVLAERINQTVDKAMGSESSAPYAKQLRHAVQRLVDVTATLWAAGDIATTLANSTIYLEAAGHVVVAWIWLEQLIAASDHQGDFYDGKTRCGTVLLRLRAAEGGPAVRSAGQPGSHHRGRAAKLVLIRRRGRAQALASASASSRFHWRKVSSVRPRRQYPEMDAAHLASTPRSLRM